MAAARQVEPAPVVRAKTPTYGTTGQQSKPRRSSGGFGLGSVIGFFTNPVKAFRDVIGFDRTVGRDVVRYGGDVARAGETGVRDVVNFDRSVYDAAGRDVRTAYGDVIKVTEAGVNDAARFYGFEGPVNNQSSKAAPVVPAKRAVSTNYATDLENGVQARATAEAMKPAEGETKPSKATIDAAERKATKVAPRPKETIVEETEQVAVPVYSGAAAPDTSGGSTTSTTSKSGLLGSLTSGGALPIILIGGGGGFAIWYYTKGRKK